MTNYPLIWKPGPYTGAMLPNCQDCNTRGNITQSADGVYRCRWCSQANCDGCRAEYDARPEERSW